MTGAPRPDRVVVLVGADAHAAALGEVARGLESTGARTAVFVGDVTDPEGRAALEEFVAELFPTEPAERI